MDFPKIPNLPGLPKIQPTEFSPAEMARLRGIGTKPAGIVSGVARMDAEKRFEELEAGQPLSSDYAWFCLGLAYCMVKIDRSLFEVFQSAGNRSFALKTHRADSALCTVDKASYHTNPWSATVQGLPRNLGQTFADFVSSYEFVRKDTGDTWKVEWLSAPVHDPFVAGHVVDIHYAMPVNVTKKRKFMQLWRHQVPVLGMVHVQG